MGNVMSAEHQIATGWLDIPVDGEVSPMSAYLAEPVAPGARPAVVVGPEVFGLTGYVRAVADRLARCGYVAVVPDFYHRQGRRIALPADAAGRARGLELLHSVRRDTVRGDVAATLSCLREREGEQTRAAMLGLSSGGHIAYYAATQFPLASLIVFYPGWLPTTDIPLSRPEPTLALTPAIAEQGTRVLFLVGGQDPLIPPGQREAIAACLRQAGVDHEFVVYPTTPHAFACEERDSFRPAAAADAWDRALRLLAETTRPAG